MSGLSAETCLSKFKFVSLATSELLAFNVQKLGQTWSFRDLSLGLETSRGQIFKVLVLVLVLRPKVLVLVSVLMPTVSVLVLVLVSRLVCGC